jgi:glyoxylase-like metal-dependent hydrolase (beta-lactamase superfamily II)
MKLHILDLHFLDNLQTIAAFLIESSEGLILVETGPYSTFSHLEKGVTSLGFAMKDIRHVVVTHIHFDHAGAAWALAELGANVYVHPFGYPHLLEPSKLYESAKRIYQDDMDRLWSIMKPIHASQLFAVEHGDVFHFGDVELKAWHTPGHAHHHIAWQWGDVLFTGDVAGVKINNGVVVSPCPPPDIDLEKWSESLDLILKLQPKKLFLTHYGIVTEIESHLRELESDLKLVSEWVRKEYQKGTSLEVMTPMFDNFVKENLIARGVDEIDLKRYQAANPAWMSVAGLVRYWKKKLG